MPFGGHLPAPSCRQKALHAAWWPVSCAPRPHIVARPPKTAIYPRLMNKLGIDWPGKNRLPVQGLDGLTWYFEFNNKKLVLKVKRCDSATAEDARRWIRSARNAIKDMPTSVLPETETPRGGKYAGTYLSVIRWPLRWEDLDAVADQVHEAFSLFGTEGLLCQSRL